MKQQIITENFKDEQGNPAGGYARSVGHEGLSVQWQDGPLGREPERKAPNGAFVEDLLEVGLQRLRFYQDSRFHCEENAMAISHLEQALRWLIQRTERRETQGVEGTHDGT